MAGLNPATVLNIIGRFVAAGRDESKPLNPSNPSSASGTGDGMNPPSQGR